LLKHPDLPYFAVPHPMSALSDEALVKGADLIYDEIAKIVANSLPPVKPESR
jgi:hypothetical protein